MFLSDLMYQIRYHRPERFVNKPAMRTYHLRRVVAAGVITSLIISNLQRYIAAAAEGLGQSKKANLVPGST